MSGRIPLAFAALSALFVSALFAGRAAAQDIPLDLFAPLAAKATEHVEITLDSNLLQWAGRFLSGTDPDEVKAKQLVAGLKGIYIRSYTFSKPGEYSTADVDRVRSQLKAWTKIVSVHEAHEDTGIYLRTEGDKVLGLVVVAAEPTELTLINIVGSIEPDQLKALSGKFGIPDLGDLGQKAGAKKKEE
jgi:hypothetical protein